MISDVPAVHIWVTSSKHSKIEVTSGYRSSLIIEYIIAMFTTSLSAFIILYAIAHLLYGALSNI
jgi:hypothetical protein